MEAQNNISNTNPLLYFNNIDVNDASLETPLSQLQANILKYHGRPYAWHVFIKFYADKKEAVKDWICKYAWKVTTAKSQLEDVELRRNNPAYDGGTIMCFFLSKTGYDTLGIDVSNFWGSKLQSMRDRTEDLADPPLEKWEDVYQDSIHAMILLADGYKEKLGRELDIIRRQTKDIAHITHVQQGAALRNENGLPVEHFGYVDGISQPRFLKGEVSPGSAWNDNKNLGAVLVQENVKDYDNCFGSFLVFRKLEQDVKLFNQKVNALAGSLSPGNTNADAAKLAAAYVVGRFKNGTPVVKHPHELNIHHEKELDNDFNFNNDEQGHKCPFHAHIRAVTPRDIGPCYDLNRIVRRGIPYDEAGRNGDMSWYPEKKVGLLFMCYQPNIRTYFEKLQVEWASHGNVGTKKIPMDGIISQGNTNARPQQWPVHWDGPDVLEGFRFSDTVTLKGGEYFFAPSIPFLLQIKQF